MKDFNKAQKISFWTLLSLSIVSVLVIAFICYIFLTVKKPETLGVSYASTITTDTGEVPICVLDIWSNDNNNGQKAYDLQINSFTDSEGKGVKGLGIQIVGDYEVYLSNQDFTLGDNPYSVWNSSILVGESYLYCSDDMGVSTYSTSKDKIGDVAYINIKDKFYSVNLNVDVTRSLDVSNFWKSLQFVFGNPQYNTNEIHYSWFDLANYIIKSAESSSAKSEFGTYYLNYLDCAQFYHLLVNDNGQYVELDDTTYLRNYMQIQVNYHKDGLRYASDSRFNQVANSTTWEFGQLADTEDYWTNTNTLTINEGYINLLESEALNGYYITIDKGLVDYINSRTNKKVIVYINLDNIGDNVVGIYMDNFDLDVSEFTIYSSKNQNFYVFNATKIVPTLAGGLV